MNQLVKDSAAYAELFAPGARLRYRGDVSTSYLWDAASPERIREAARDARILICLRDPVERAYANYWGHIRVGLDTRTFADAVHEELADEQVDLAATPAPHVARGFYDEQVVRYLDLFPDATLVLLFDEFVADVRGTMGRVFEWLGLDSEHAETLDPAPVFPFFVPRNAAVTALRRLPSVQRAGQVLVHGALRARLDRAALSEKPPLGPELRRVLRKVYAPDAARLRDLLGRALPWDGHE